MSGTATLRKAIPSIMSVTNRRGGNAPAPRNRAVEPGERVDKKVRKPLLKIPVLSGLIVAVLLVIVIVLLLPSPDSGPRIEKKPHVSSRQPEKRIGQDEQQQGELRHAVLQNVKQKRNLKDTNDVQHYMIFSTGCTTYQDWQSYTFFYHALKVGQPGHVTRIASGCKPEEAEELKRLHKELIEVMSENFHLHLTPDFSGVKPGLIYKYFNKPYGVRHWMEHGPLGYPSNKNHDDAIVLLLDPDQMLLRPLTHNFTNTLVDWKPTKARDKPKLLVEHGSPFAQGYGYEAQWKHNVNVTHVAGPNSPIEDVTIDQARDYYPVGPPYIGTARDMYKIVKKWCEFALPAYDDYPNLLAEMFAYSLAAAHLELPHQIANSFMVSDPTTDLEGWKLIDPIKAEDVCYNVPPSQRPHVLHYSHSYILGKWFFYKSRIRGDFVSCESPMLMEPPSDVAVGFNNVEGVALNAKGEVPYGNRPHVNRRRAFMLCHIVFGLNEAAEFFKKHNCKTANFSKSVIP